jgi:positive phototaxis protein PixI
MAEQLRTQSISPFQTLLTQEQGQTGELQFLTFPLGQDTSAMLPVNQLAEVLNLSYAQIMPIPEMESWVLGVYNWRGEMLWVLDLAGLVGLPALHQQLRNASNCKVLVSKTQPSSDKAPIYLGFAVKAVEDMYWCTTDDIKSAPNTAITSGLIPYLAGYTLGQKGQMLMALNALAITEQINTQVTMA